jgi:hypothetical protein
MTFLRKIVVLVFLGVFVGAFVLAALGSTKKIEMVDGALTGIFAVLIGQCLTAIVTVFRSPDFWKDDPESVAKIKKENLHAMAQKDAAHLKEKAEMQARFAESNRQKDDLAAQQAKENAKLKDRLRPIPPNSQTHVS